MLGLELQSLISPLDAAKDYSASLNQYFNVNKKIILGARCFLKHVLSVRWCKGTKRSCEVERSDVFVQHETLLPLSCNTFSSDIGVLEVPRPSWSKRHKVSLSVIITPYHILLQRLRL